ncbi:glycosyltransferase [Oryzibacter oryziterrae]|uniref:glycosyltransferase n=1 Tax=Oryzibacter oryziterrae TaxID=2766474 RepID=UPI001F2715AE|nr:glycosyltransferase [Oryzibacter oryziterrae]
MPATLYVDHTHLGRTVTGLERITLELFSPDSLAPLTLVPVRGGSTARMMLAQQFGLTARVLGERGALVLCPGFPPSIPLSLFGRARVIPYIHDCFLITRPQDLNWRAAHYMAPAFRYAVTHLPWFLVNSEATREELRRFCRADAEISLYRPVVRDVFGVEEIAARANRQVSPGGRLDLIAVGTIEPRKNLAAAAEIVRRLRDTHGFDARLNLVGRPGWGGEAERLAGLPGVVVHGYQSAERVRELLTEAHVFLSTSHDEGLGLPLLEAQYAGLPIVAPIKPVFSEVLGGSGLHVDPASPSDAAAAIAALVLKPDVFSEARQAAARNIARWNSAAEGDRQALIERLMRLSA